MLSLFALPLILVICSAASHTDAFFTSNLSDFSAVYYSSPTKTQCHPIFLLFELNRHWGGNVTYGTGCRTSVHTRDGNPVSLGITKGNTLIFLSFSINIGMLLLQFNTAILPSQGIHSHDYPPQTATPMLWGCLQQCSLQMPTSATRRGSPNCPSPNPVHNLEMELDLSNNGLTYNTSSVLGT